MINKMKNRIYMHSYFTQTPYVSIIWLRGCVLRYPSWRSCGIPLGTVVTSGIVTLVPPRMSQSFHDYGTGVTITMEQL